MRTLLIYLALVFTLSLTMMGCDSGEPSATPNTNKAATTDSDLENSIKAKLDSDAQLKAANISVNADIKDKTATLSGTVETQALRTKALDLAKAAQAGLVITDKIDVKPREVSRSEYTDEMAREARAKAKGTGETIGDSLDDAWLHTKVVAKLIGNSATPERKINVDVVNNIVTLRGTVDSAEQKAEAERVAKTTEGIKSVKNMLTVKKA